MIRKYYVSSEHIPIKVNFILFTSNEKGDKYKIVLLRCHRVLNSFAYAMCDISRINTEKLTSSSGSLRICHLTILRVYVLYNFNLIIFHFRETYLSNSK